jgi:hypothetical protein
MGEHGVTGRVADALADTLGNDQAGRHIPPTGQGKYRNGQEVDQISDDRNGPVGPRAVTQVPRKEAHGIAEEFAEARDDADSCGTCSKHAKIWTSNAASPFIGHICKKANNAHQYDEEDSVSYVPRVDRSFLLLS